MALEREAKIQVESHGPIRERLQSSGAERLGRVLETNLIFDRPDGALRGKGIGFRVRTARDLETGRRATAMTVKGPVKFRPNNTAVVVYGLRQWQNGKQQIIWPPDIATAKLLLAPPWSKR